MMSALRYPESPVTIEEETMGNNSGFGAFFIFLLFVAVLIGAGFMLSQNDQLQREMDETNAGMRQSVVKLVTAEAAGKQLAGENAGLKNQVAEKEKVVQTQTAVISAKDQAITNLNNSAAQKDATINALNARVSEQGVQINNLAAANKNQEATVNDLKGQVAQKDQTIATKDKAITELNSRVNEKDANLAAVTTKLAEKESELQVQTEAVQAQATAIANLNGSVTAQQKKIEQMASAAEKPWLIPVTAIDPAGTTGQIALVIGVMLAGVVGLVVVVRNQQVKVDDQRKPNRSTAPQAEEGTLYVKMTREEAREYARRRATRQAAVSPEEQPARNANTYSQERLRSNRERLMKQQQN
jgi:uncharacterized coiled-coil protein SlyX